MSSKAVKRILVGGGVLALIGVLFLLELIPAYILLAIAGVIGLTRLRILDNLISIYVLSAVTTPFFVIYSWNAKQWWALIPGGITAVIGMSFLIARGAVGSSAALALLVITASILVRASVSRDPAGRATLPRSDEPAPSEP